MIRRELSERASLTPAKSQESSQWIFHEPSSAWRYLNVRELWRFRELILTLAARDLKVRYRQTLVGAAWAIIQPVTTMVIFTALFTLLGRVPVSEGVPYAVALFCGLLPWQLFSCTLTQASTCLVNNRNLITKVYFPRTVLPIASLLGGLVDFAIAFVIFMLMLAYYGVTPSWTIVLMPCFVFMVMLASLAAGLWLSAMNALYRDVGHLMPFLIQLGFYLSPVVYEANELIPAKWRLLYSLNPMVGILEGFRWSVLGQHPPALSTLVISWVGLVIILLGGILYFRRVESFLADRI